MKNGDFDGLAKLIAGMMKSKEAVICTILKDIEKAKGMADGLRKCSGSVIDNPSDENLRKMVNTTMKCVASQSDIIARLCLIALVYSGGNNYDGDAAMILNKLGHGREALKEMLRRKMGGL